MKPLRIYNVYSDNYDAVPSYNTVLRIDMNRAELRKYSTRTKNAVSLRYKLIATLKEDGWLENTGCNCSHCQNDWDCCGNWFVAYTSWVRVPRGVKLIQHYGVNV